jgi:plastocyanin
MSLIRTFTVTVANPGSGNRYYIDDVLQDTINLAEGYTYVFNYPSAHPFRFSTTSDGTHNFGSEYTTGVTVNSSTQVQITVAALAPTLYYYCSYHPNMGGQANTVDSDTWGMLTWGLNTWGSQDGISVPLTGLSTTTSLGTVIAASEDGWGADAWGDNTWGENAINVSIDGLSMSAALGPEGWGVNSFGNGQWGDPFAFNPASIIVPTGQTLSADVGDLTISRIDMVFSISAPGAIGTGIGTLGINNGSDHTQGLASLTAGSAVGSISPADVMGLTGQVIKSEVNANGVSTGDTTAFTLASVTMSAEVGSISPADVVGLTGVTFAADEGAISPTNMTVGLTGLSFTANINTVGLGTIGYQDVDITGNTSYTDVNHAA